MILSVMIKTVTYNTEHLYTVCITPAPCNMGQFQLQYGTLSGCMKAHMGAHTHTPTYPHARMHTNTQLLRIMNYSNMNITF